MCLRWTTSIGEYPRFNVRRLRLLRRLLWKACCGFWDARHPLILQILYLARAPALFGVLVRSAMKKLLLSIVAATLAVSIGCGGSNSSSGGSSSPGGGSKVTLQSIQVTPAVTSVVVGANQTFKATGTYSDGSSQDLTASAKWGSSSTSVATIGSGGVATCKSPGVTTITAKSQGVSGTSTLTVTAIPPTLTSIVVTPANPSVVAGQTLQFSSTGIYSDGSTQDLSSSLTWNSSDTNVVTIVSGGMATSKNPGTTTITAKDGSTGIIGTSVL